MSIEIQKIEILTRATKFIVVDCRRKIARGYLYDIKNDLHNQPYGLIEDVFIEPEFRWKGYGTLLVKELIAEANTRCYKLIATARDSRPKAHEFYKKLGFDCYGKEFRMNF